MKRTLLAGSCLVVLVWTGSAKAQIPVTDVMSHVMEQLGVQNQYAELAKWVQQLQAMQQQYQMLMNQYNAIAHLPQNISGIASGLTTSPTLMNPFPQSYQLSGILNGSSLGPVTGLANQLNQANTFFSPTGSDPGAVEMRARAQGLSGVQAMATDAMKSLETRAADLKDFLASIGSSPDIQQTAAIQARLQLEQNYVAGQQAQATQLATLANTQVQVNQQRDAQMSRKDAEDWQKSVSSIAGW